MRYYKLIKKSRQACNKRTSLNYEEDKLNSSVWVKHPTYGMVISARSIDALDYEKYFNGPKIMSGK